ncbi:MAG: hypothetical protein PVG26_05840, partial [Desulfobacterales bacterium]
DPTYILPVLLRNAKPNNGRFPNQVPKVSFLIRLDTWPAATLLNKMWDRLTAMATEERLIILRVAAESHSHDDQNITRTDIRQS